MKNNLFLFSFFVFNFSFAQVEVTIDDSDNTITNKKITYTQFDFSVPLQGNKNRGEVFPDGSTNDNWFVPEGVNLNFGYGVHFKKWIGVSANTGLEMKLSEKLVIAPVFANLRFMPKLSEDLRIGFDYSHGKSFALGRGNLSGTFQRIKLNFESEDNEFQLFIALFTYGFNLHEVNNKMTGISLGFTILNFY